MRFLSVIFICIFVYMFLLSSITSAEESEGKIYFERNGDIWNINSDGTKEIQLSNIGKFVSPVLSPDGKKIVYVSQPHRMMNGQGGLIGIANTDGSNPISVSDYHYSDTPGAQWFPDSKTFRDGKNIFNLKGEKIEEINSLFDRDCKHSPDGSEIACYVFEDDEIITWLSPINRYSPEKIISFSNTFPPRSGYVAESNFDDCIKWAPDNRKMLICEVISAGDEIKNTWWYINLEDYKKNIVLQGGRFISANWTLDSKHIVYVRHNYELKNTEIYLINPDRTGEKHLLSKEGIFSVKYWSPDGKKMLCKGGDYSRPEMWICEMESGKFYKIANNANPIGWVQ